MRKTAIILMGDPNKVAISLKNIRRAGIPFVGKMRQNPQGDDLALPAWTHMASRSLIDRYSIYARNVSRLALTITSDIHCHITIRESDFELAKLAALTVVERET